MILLVRVLLRLRIVPVLSHCAQRRNRSKQVLVQLTKRVPVPKRKRQHWTESKQFVKSADLNDDLSSQGLF